MNIQELYKQLAESILKEQTKQNTFWSIEAMKRLEESYFWFTQSVENKGEVSDLKE